MIIKAIRELSKAINRLASAIEQNSTNKTLNDGIPVIPIGK